MATSLARARAATSDVVARAGAKLVAKGLDLVVANDVSAPGAGFDHDTNEVTILGADGSRRHVTRAPKREIAAAVVDEIVGRSTPD